MTRFSLSPSYMVQTHHYRCLHLLQPHQGMVRLMMLQLSAGGLEPPASWDGPTDHSMDGSPQVELAVAQRAGVGCCLLTLCRLAACRSLFSWSSWSCILSRASLRRAFSSASLWASSSRLDNSSWHLCREAWLCLCQTGGEDSVALLPLPTL